MKEEKLKKKIKVSNTIILILIIIFITLLFLSYYMVNKYFNKEDEPVVKTEVEIEVQKVEKYTANDVIKIQKYLDKTYSFLEFSMPEFTNINEASEEWLFGIALFNIPFNEQGTPYDDVMKSAKSLFGPEFTNKFKKEDTKVAFYSALNNTFTIEGRGGAMLNPKYVISNIEKTLTGFNVEIIEYISEDSNMATEENIYLLNKTERVQTFLYGQEKQMEEYVLANKAKFNTKQIVLSEDKVTKEIYIVSSKNI